MTLVDNEAPPGRSAFGRFSILAHYSLFERSKGKGHPVAPGPLDRVRPRAPFSSTTERRAADQHSGVSDRGNGPLYDSNADPLRKELHRIVRHARDRTVLVGIQDKLATLGTSCPWTPPAVVPAADIERCGEER